MNLAVIAVKKAEFQEAKRNTRNGSKRVLHELVQGLENLYNIESTDKEALVSTCLSDASDRSTDTHSESQESKPIKDVDRTMKVGRVFVLDAD